MKAAVVDRQGHVLMRLRRPTEAQDGADAVVGRIVEVIGDLSSWTRSSTGDAAAAVGVVVPGLVDEEAGIAREAANLGWRDLPLRQIVASQSGLTTALGHDVRAGAVAEGLLGAARGSGNYLFLPIGTGIAAVLVVNGEPHAGAHFPSSEIGHIVVEPDGERCGCGRRGCLETVASAKAIARRYAARVGDDVRVDAAEVVRRALRGDVEAREVWQAAIAALAETLATVALIVDPELIVVAGGMSAAGDALIKPLSSGIPLHLSYRLQPRILCSRLGDEAACLGAAIAAWRVAGVDNATRHWTPR